MLWLTRSSDGVVLHLRVTPKAAADRIGGIAEDASGRSFLKVYVRAVPDKGKANDAVIRLLAKSWGLPKSAFVIRAGAGDRNKTMAITGNSDQLMAALAPHYAPENEEDKNG